jgi:putative sigma-54 modulation protein
MQTSVTFKNLDPSEALKAYVRKKLDRFDKLLDSPVEANVVLSVEKIRHIAEINLAGDGLSIQAKEETNNMYSSIDRLVDKLKTQITKTKQKSRNQTAGAKEHIKGRIMEEDILKAEEENAGQVMIEHIDYKPMDIEEAILQINLVPDNFIVFTNARTEKVNVLYRRNDGHFGLIQPRS